MKDQSSAIRGAVHMQCDAWRVSVFEEEVLNQGALRWGVMEFFLKILTRICQQMALPLTCGSAHLGKTAGTAETSSALLRVVEKWKEVWRGEEVKKSQEFLLPVAVDDRNDPQDWIRVSIVSSKAGAVLDGKNLCVYVFLTRQNVLRLFTVWQIIWKCCSEEFVHAHSLERLRLRSPLVQKLVLRHNG